MRTARCPIVKKEVGGAIHDGSARRGVFGFFLVAFGCCCWSLGFFVASGECGWTREFLTVNSGF
jgi:hypothetical protein